MNEDPRHKQHKRKATLKALYRSVPALKQPLMDKQMAHIAWEEHVQHVAREGQSPSHLPPAPPVSARELSALAFDFVQCIGGEAWPPALL